MLPPMQTWTTVRIGTAPFIAIDHAGAGELMLGATGRPA